MEGQKAIPEFDARRRKRGGPRAHEASTENGPGGGGERSGAGRSPPRQVGEASDQVGHRGAHREGADQDTDREATALAEPRRHDLRSEEHTSELQSRPHLVCRLLLEKKKTLESGICRGAERGNAGL